MSQITIPYKFEPRTYQLELLRALDSGVTRAIAAYHRRAGKDKTLFNILIKKAFERRGTYYYFFPEFSQGRRVIWDGMDGSGMPFRDHIPNELIEGLPSKQEMKIHLKNGSIIQIIGTDSFDKVRGSNPIGCVFSEYAFQNPAAWNVVRPILAENGGWAVFNSTPFGKNHFYKMFLMAKENPKWYSQLVTVEDSVDENGVRYIPEDVIEEERISGMSEEMVQQEYYCSFTANSQGFYYLKYLEDALDDKRVTDVPCDPAAPVDTWWDIGVGDSTAIWFTQIVDRRIHVIDFYQRNTVGLEHYVKYLQNLPYIYRSHNFPHDMSNTEFGSGRSRIEVADELFKGSGARLEVGQKLGFDDGVNATRMILPRCWFDRLKCAEGIDALQNYHRKWDDKHQEFMDKPVRNWCTHAADAFRYFAMGLTIPREKSRKNEFMLRQKKKISAKGWMVA